MEFTKTELDVLEKVTQDNATEETKKLLDLQLALVGGGIADPVWA